MTTRASGICLVFCSLGLACGGGPVGVKAFHDGSLVVTASQRGLSVALVSKSDCPTLNSSAQGTLNGEPMTVTSRGALGPGLGPTLPSCIRPQFDGAVNGAPDAGATIVIEDGAGSIHTFVSAPGVPRSVGLSVADGGAFATGARATVRWPESSETLLADDTLISLKQMDGGTVFVGQNDLSVNGDELAFIVPQLPSGPVELHVHALHLTLTQCDGMERCTLDSAEGLANATVP
ncbi:MAG: hypothetical protein ACJ790_03965 [Myxococcaceae bacterium]